MLGQDIGNTSRYGHHGLRFGDQAATTGVTVDSAAVTMTDPDAASKGSVTIAIVIGVIGVVIGAIGVGLALAARRRPAA